MRQWRDGDWVGLRRTYGDTEVMGWLGVGPLPLGYGMFAVEERASGEIVGRIGLMLHPDWPLDGPKVEVGWTLQRSAWGHGYATEGARASLEFGFRGWRQVHYAIDREGWPPQGDPTPRQEIRTEGRLKV